jgi:ribosomal protein S18 acetylase RimI-like enzyme
MLTTFSYYENDKNIGKIQFNSETGEICYFYIYPKYRGYTLGKQLLIKAMQSIKNKGKTDKIWGLSDSKDIDAWYKNIKHYRAINKVDRCKYLPKYEIYI